MVQPATGPLGNRVRRATPTVRLGVSSFSTVSAALSSPQAWPMAASGGAYLASSQWGGLNTLTEEGISYGDGPMPHQL